MTRTEIIAKLAPTAYRVPNGRICGLLISSRRVAGFWIEADADDSDRKTPPRWIVRRGTELQRQARAERARM